MDPQRLHRVDPLFALIEGRVVGGLTAGSVK
jgi:hypothetical protein